MAASPIERDLVGWLDLTRQVFLEVERRADALADEQLDLAVFTARAGILEAADRAKQLQRVDVALDALLEQVHGTVEQLEHERYGHEDAA